MSEHLHLRLHATAGGLCLDARGRLDVVSRGRLAQALTAIFDHLPMRRLVLGLYRLDAIDRAGVAALVAAQEQARQRGVDLLVRGPQDHVRAALAALGAVGLLADGADESWGHLPSRLRRRLVRAAGWGCPCPTRPRSRPQRCARPTR
ncbi:hypothetical protein CS0771_46510 [Catellatospora sp. IY07-71]|uniref:STAS domain-containing protein n=1 Tax=Catellatospora sp. IY07-71 TaxID=2728827 RepID=UPI001BB3EA63|nr:STAS domain-containing protein [Catellatospora sp. IY07-71]BCJ75107.1 hypothetical protein CS0771_46510 [Catellatospora sp. IY07-71]